MHVSKEKTLLSRLLVITRKRVSRSWPVLPAGLAPSGTNLEKETDWKKKAMRQRRGKKRGGPDGKGE